LLLVGSVAGQLTACLRELVAGTLELGGQLVEFLAELAYLLLFPVGVACVAVGCVLHLLEFLLEALADLEVLLLPPVLVLQVGLQFSDLVLEIAAVTLFLLDSLQFIS
jgi:hypothetical protein